MFGKTKQSGSSTRNSTHNRRSNLEAAKSSSSRTARTGVRNRAEAGSSRSSTTKCQARHSSGSSANKKTSAKSRIKACN